MKVSGVADRRRAVVRRMGLLFTLNNVLQRRQMRRLTARDHIGEIGAWGAPWRQGCRCDDHQQLVGLLRDKALQPLSEALMHHFDHIVASLCFERDGVSLPDFSRLFAGHKES